MAVAEPDLWELTRGRPQVDPARLAAAIERQAGCVDLDFRSRLLIRDGVEALTRHWGRDRVEAWLAKAAYGERINAIRQEDLGQPGFPSLAARLMDATKPDQILQFLRELGTYVRHDARLCVGGSAALILAGNLQRHTENIDVVDELPAEVRTEHALLEALEKRYGLQLAHFQSHYLPNGWEARVRSAGRFGRLQVLLIDPVDVLLSKLFSTREKDRDDLRLVAPQLDREELVRRYSTEGRTLVGEPWLRQAAATYGYIVFGEPLPDAPGT
jgi:hypothetical protein